ncbi:hypothetical protein Nepgr_021228 [Nepenthes gracilis]|uniref:Uncharacterized protein n=1 Tax=Nepenthes gracilis TaxID=150966 RepID=A0AAD3SYG3_NEPGR|nr:hypothetical protein Nepgr_021228 [Nepenthes gracilis]
MNENDTHVAYRMFVQVMTTNGIPPKGKPEEKPERGAPEPLEACYFCEIEENLAVRQPYIAAQREAFREVPEHLVVSRESNTMEMNVSDTIVADHMFVDRMNTNGKAPNPKPEAILEPGAPKPSFVTFPQATPEPPTIIIGQPVSNTEPSYYTGEPSFITCSQAIPVPEHLKQPLRTTVGMNNYDTQVGNQNGESSKLIRGVCCCPILRRVKCVNKLCG